MYASLGDNEWVVYDYRPTGSGSGPCEFLGKRKGWVQADAGGAFDPLFALGRAKEAGCWSHARRYFEQAVNTDRRAAIALKWIWDLFMVEREAADMPPEDRLAGNGRFEWSSITPASTSRSGRPSSPSPARSAVRRRLCASGSAGPSVIRDAGPG
jgi:hypothetical protein